MVKDLFSSFTIQLFHFVYSQLTTLRRSVCINEPTNIKGGFCVPDESTLFRSLFPGHESDIGRENAGYLRDHFPHASGRTMSRNPNRVSFFAKSNFIPSSLHWRQYRFDDGLLQVFFIMPSSSWSCIIVVAYRVCQFRAHEFGRHTIALFPFRIIRE